MFLNVGVVEPVIDEVPLKITVPSLCVNVAPFERLPVNVRLPEGAVKVPAEFVNDAAVTFV